MAKKLTNESKDEKKSSIIKNVEEEEEKSNLLLFNKQEDEVDEDDFWDEDDEDWDDDDEDWDEDDDDWDDEDFWDDDDEGLEGFKAIKEFFDNFDMVSYLSKLNNNMNIQETFKSAVLIKDMIDSTVVIERQRNKPRAEFEKELVSYNKILFSFPPPLSNLVASYLIRIDSSLVLPYTALGINAETPEMSDPYFLRAINNATDKYGTDLSILNDYDKVYKDLELMNYSKTVISFLANQLFAWKAENTKATIDKYKEAGLKNLIIQDIELTYYLIYGDKHRISEIYDQITKKTVFSKFFYAIHFCNENDSETTLDFAVEEFTSKDVDFIQALQSFLFEDISLQELKDNRLLNIFDEYEKDIYVKLLSMIFEVYDNAPLKSFIRNLDIIKDSFKKKKK